MKVKNLIKWSLIGALMTAFLSIDPAPVNASTESATGNPSITQQDKPLKRHRNNRRKHRRHRRWKRHHPRRMDTNTNNDKRVPPKNENK
jgi:hypothetical protein